MSTYAEAAPVVASWPKQFEENAPKVAFTLLVKSPTPSCCQDDVDDKLALFG